ncbi:MAG: thiamine pyrophosphate-dependent dehydrogenase E1 component subunit alpha [Acidimicrobiaceae bacterium]|nr:thiamine pyrophosphate-dependent dehydrogenase E1 component subunit alpha [Acidimicrobiaceae bacterium]
MVDASPVPPADTRRRMFELMSVMKATDERMVKGITSGEFIAIYYPHRGQEAVAAALGAALRPSDQLVSTYRNMHDHIGKGVPLVDLLGAVLARASSPDRGKGGTMHIASPEAGSMLSTGIVGGGVPVAIGLAMTAQLDGSDRVTAVCFGDGATNTGAFHEAANMAALWDLPVVLVCQNNLYGEMTPIDMTMKIGQVADRAAGYGMPGVRVNGNDPDETYGALADAVERARSGGGPTLVECVTFRFGGHSIGDDMRYIPKEQMAEAQKHDPFPAYRQRLLSEGVATEEELAGVEAAAATTVNDAVAQVTREAPPAPDELRTHVYEHAEKMPV